MRLLEFIDSKGFDLFFALSSWDLVSFVYRRLKQSDERFTEFCPFLDALFDFIFPLVLDHPLLLQLLLNLEHLSK